MRLPSKSYERIFALSLVSLLAACGGGAATGPGLASASSVPFSSERPGPEADYPIVLGDPYTVDGKLFTPSDSLDHDEVGYATVDQTAAIGVTASHKTLPLPSYIEVTALDSGKTVLIRVERRGPMTSSRAVGLSAGAMAELGIGADGAPVRVRRVNPPEVDRAKLRVGEAASFRMDMPASLIAVLRRSLPASGSVNLAHPRQASVSQAASSAFAQSTSDPVVEGEELFRAPRQATSASGGRRGANRAYPLPSLRSTSSGGAAAANVPAPIPSRSNSEAFFRENRRVATITQAPAPVRVARPAVQSRQQTQHRPSSGDFVVQAAAYSNEASARRAANKIGGFVERSGRIYRVRMGPFVNRGQANAALAKVRREGYRDARVFTAG